MSERIIEILIEKLEKYEGMEVVPGFELKRMLQRTLIEYNQEQEELLKDQRDTLFDG